MKCFEEEELMKQRERHRTEPTKHSKTNFNTYKFAELYNFIRHKYVVLWFIYGVLWVPVCPATL